MVARPSHGIPQLRLPTYLEYLYKFANLVFYLVPVSLVLGFSFPQVGLSDFFTDTVRIGALSPAIGVITLLSLLAVNGGIIYGILRSQYAFKREGVAAGLTTFALLVLSAVFAFAIRVHLRMLSDVKLERLEQQDVLSAWDTLLVAGLTVTSTLPLLSSVYGLLIGNLSKVDYRKFQHYFDAVFRHIEEIERSHKQNDPVEVRMHGEDLRKVLRAALQELENAAPNEAPPYRQYLDTTLIQHLRNLKEFTDTNDFRGAPQIVLELHPDSAPYHDWIKNEPKYRESYARLVNLRDE